VASLSPVVVWSSLVFPLIPFNASRPIVLELFFSAVFWF